MTAGARKQIINEAKEQWKDPKGWNRGRYEANVSFHQLDTLKKFAGLSGKGSEMKGLIPHAHAMIKADKDMIQENAESPFPLVLYGTDNGTFLEFMNHLQLVFKQAFIGKGKKYKDNAIKSFCVWDSATKKFRLRTSQDEVRKCVFTITLDGIAVLHGLGCVNLVTGEPSNCTHLSRCDF